MILPPYVRRPGGRIVHLSSIAAVRGPGSHRGAKAAVRAYTAAHPARGRPPR
ncbi:hypothetical protein [Streptomyces sp. CBMA29]|uniref:hypothetical protein n=1 Tax=Streptomyces sp. CBMA29 TaxID=1896314 RepID=UPI0016620CE4|nr:hypothetical protein [Streptomyces sp. CBMA29]